MLKEYDRVTAKLRRPEAQEEITAVEHRFFATRAETEEARRKADESYESVKEKIRSLEEIRDEAKAHLQEQDLSIEAEPQRAMHVEYAPVMELSLTL